MSLARRSERASRRKSRKRTEALVAGVELGLIRRRRRARGVPVDAPLAGLALSGDGTAGAAFSLGVARALSEQPVFRRFDYLSSVSGGALAAACIVWFSRLRCKLQAPGPGQPLVPPEALRYIREHAGTTQAAHFSNRSDRRRSRVERERGLGAVVLRSTALSLFVHGALLVGLFFLLDRLDAIVGLMKPMFRLLSVRPPWSSIVNGLNAGMLAGALWLLIAILWSVLGTGPKLFWRAWQRSGRRAQPVGWGRAGCGAVWLLLALAAWVFIASILFGRSSWVARVAWIVPLAASSAIAFARWRGLWRFGQGSPRRPFEKRLVALLKRGPRWLAGLLTPRPSEAPGPRRQHAALALLLGLLPTAILIGSIHHYVFASGVLQPATPAQLNGVAGLALFAFTLIYVALLVPRAWRRLAAFGTSLFSRVPRSEATRAKQHAARRQYAFARLLRYSGLGFVLGTVPMLATELASWLPRPELRVAALAAFVVIGVLFVVQAAPPPIGRMPGSLNGTLSTWAALIGGIVLMYGTLLLAQLCVSAALGSSVPGLVCLLPLAGALVGVLHDVNQASPGAAYRDRLADAFLPDDQAVRAGHWQPAVSAVSFPLTRAAQSSHVPYPLFNAAVHITRSNDARLQRYGADNFVLSPLFCGSAVTRYGNTRHWERGSLSLSDVLGICTAAVSPMTVGVSASTLRRRLYARALSLLNLRLSYWADNPRFSTRDRDARGSRSRPNFLRPLLGQLLGRGLSERQRHVELADGAHFEALGLYELVRRRLQLIVVVDATRDPDLEFVELERSLQLIRAELGVEVDVPVEAVASSLERESFAVSIGSVQYPGHDRPCPLVYFKAPPNPRPERQAAEQGAPASSSERGRPYRLDEVEFEEQQHAGYRAGNAARALLERLATESLGGAS